MLDAFSKSKNAYHLTETAHEFFDMIEETGKAAAARGVGEEDGLRELRDQVRELRAHRAAGAPRRRNPLHMTLDDVFRRRRRAQTFADGCGPRPAAAS